MSFLEKHLWRHVFRTAAETVGEVVFHDLGQAVVCESDMPLGVDDDVLWFEIPVEYFLFVEMADGQQGLQKIEFGLFFCHSLHFFKEIEQLSTITELHTEDQIVFSLETEIELGDEGMANTFLKDHSFIFDYVFFLVFDDELFLDDFQRHDLPVSSCEVYFGETPSTDTF